VAKENLTNGKSEAVHEKHCKIVEGHIHRPLGSNASMGPTTSQAELSNIRSNVGKAAIFTILTECHCSNAADLVDKVMGKVCVPYPETTTLLDE